MLNCVDLFSGAGGLSWAARSAGLEVRLAVESDRHAVATYRKNLGNVARPPKVLHGDIRAIAPCDAYALAYETDEKCDLVLGGPPCQGFSTHRFRDSGVGDMRNDLIHVYFSFVRAFEPSVFLMENVPGLLWPRHSDMLKRFYDEGTQAGYDLQPPAIIDARDFGVPQRRKRVFILGVKRSLSVCDLQWPPKATHGRPTATTADSTLKPWQNCEHVFAEAISGDDNDVHMRHKPELIEAFRNTPANGGSRSQSGRVLTCHEGHNGHSDVYGRIDPTQPAPTMTTACINPSKGRFVHPTLHHGITVRQAARIQTFPESFCFSGGLMAAGAQIGNAVPVMLGEALIRHLRPLLGQGRSFAPANRIADRDGFRQAEVASG